MFEGGALTEAGENEEVPTGFVTLIRRCAEGVEMVMTRSTARIIRPIKAL